MEKNKEVIELGVLEELEDSGVSAIALVDSPAIEKFWIYMKSESFVDPRAGETQDEFISRCMSTLVGDEGYEQDQAYAICISTYEEKASGINTAGLTPYADEVPKKKMKQVSQYNTKFATDEDQQIILGPSMIPDIEIYRKDENGKPYYVKFSKETIAKVAEKFMKELRVHNTNIEHDEKVDANSFVFESWIVETPDDKANTKYGLDVPIGTWMIKLKVTDNKVWEDVKSGKYRGFSIEGNFMDKKELDEMEKEKGMLEEIMRILGA